MTPAGSREPAATPTHLAPFTECECDLWEQHSNEGDCENYTRNPDAICTPCATHWDGDED